MDPFRTYGMPVFKSTGNSAGPARTSRRFGDNYAAYDALPPPVREALQLAVQDWCPHEVGTFYRPIAHLVGPDQGDTAALLYVEAFRQAEEAEIKQHSALYFARERLQSPHVAAEASVLRTASPCKSPRAISLRSQPIRRGGRRLWAA